jgi:Flp pilus assembly protein TadG
MRRRKIGVRPREFSRFVSEESGVMVPVAIFVLLGLLGFSALVLDVGNNFAHRRGLQNAADAAALAAVRELQLERLGFAYADPYGQAVAFAGRNGVPAVYGDCVADSPATTIIANRPGFLPDRWEVEVARVVPLYFGGALGIKTRSTSSIWPSSTCRRLTFRVGTPRSRVVSSNSPGAPAPPIDRNRTANSKG